MGPHHVRLDTSAPTPCSSLVSSRTWCVPTCAEFYSVVPQYRSHVHPYPIPHFQTLHPHPVQLEAIFHTSMRMGSLSGDSSRLGGITTAATALSSSSASSTTSSKSSLTSRSSSTVLVLLTLALNVDFLQIQVTRVIASGHVFFRQHGFHTDGGRGEGTLDATPANLAILPLSNHFKLPNKTGYTLKPNTKA